MGGREEVLMWLKVFNDIDEMWAHREVTLPIKTDIKSFLANSPTANPTIGSRQPKLLLFFRRPLAPPTTRIFDMLIIMENKVLCEGVLLLNVGHLRKLFPFPKSFA